MFNTLKTKFNNANTMDPFDERIDKYFLTPLVKVQKVATVATYALVGAAAVIAVAVVVDKAKNPEYYSNED